VTTTDDRVAISRLFRVPVDQLAQEAGWNLTQSPPYVITEGVDAICRDSTALLETGQSVWAYEKLIKLANQVRDQPRSFDKQGIRQIAILGLQSVQTHWSGKLVWDRTTVFLELLEKAPVADGDDPVYFECQGDAYYCSKAFDEGYVSSVQAVEACNRGGDTLMLVRSLRNAAACLHAKVVAQAGTAVRREIAETDKGKRQDLEKKLGQIKRRVINGDDLYAHLYWHQAAVRLGSIRTLIDNGVAAAVEESVKESMGIWRRIDEATRTHKLGVLPLVQMYTPTWRTGLSVALDSLRAVQVGIPVNGVDETMVGRLYRIAQDNQDDRVANYLSDFFAEQWKGGDRVAAVAALTSNVESKLSRQKSVGLGLAT
jgi:hypothetical protein